MSGAPPGRQIEQAVMSQLLEGVQILDFEWRYVFVNAAAEIHNRRPASELVGRRYQDCWPHIEQTEVYERIGRVLAGGQADEMQNRFSYPDGSVGWFELRLLPFPQGVLILSLDVTAHRKAEGLLQNSLRLYRTLSEINQAVVRIRDSRQLFQRACDVAVEFGGFSVAWIGVLDISTGDVVPRAATGVSLDPWPYPPVNLNSGLLQNGLTAQAIRLNKVQAVDDVMAEDRGRDFRGVAARLEFRGAAAVAFRTGDGTPAALVLLSKTPGLLGAPADKSLLEEIGGDLSFALASIEQERMVRQWADAFEHCAHGIVLGDPQTNTVLTCNPAFAALMHSTRSDLEGTKFLETYKSESRQNIEALLHEADSKGSVRLEALKTRPDGTEFSALLDVVSVRDTAGKLLYRVTTIQDQTASNRLQAELLQSQKLESLGTLSSGVAHDFNNLLGIILGNAELIRQFPDDPTAQKRRLDAVISATRRGADLVKQLLTFARKTEAHFASGDLNALVSEVESLLKEIIPRNINLKTVLGPRVPPIWADLTQVQQVLVNLGVNARDAMPNGGLLSIRTSEGRRNGAWFAIVEVSDTGEGMDDSTKARIFEPFFTTKPLGKGTGLGLSTVFGILQGHGGWIEVDSTLGEGSVFRCWFPKAQTEALPPPEAPAPTVSTVSGTLLLVEDEALLRTALEDHLTRLGFRVLTAEDGIEAVDLFWKYRSEVTAVVSDLGLHRGRGDELFRALKSFAPGIRFILASGYFEPGLQEQLRTEGVWAFLQKPYDADQVIALLR